ncbi:hypothetical protein BGHDH14_bghG006346000002001 [Blumeria hordei DH14]|uniref:Uncharacterized protein n=1 Tax=Blumeria graminis f. sp. hordei (strain DH14) TaxID=546991 RepID=N1JP81_BLUG1|nr:hypothetical protein BGHDH14_bghG006346000002001 [Blumeria hordei DH14]
MEAPKLKNKKRSLEMDTEMRDPICKLAIRSRKFNHVEPDCVVVTEDKKLVVEKTIQDDVRKDKALEVPTSEGSGVMSKSKKLSDTDHDIGGAKHRREKSQVLKKQQAREKGWNIWIKDSTNQPNEKRPHKVKADFPIKPDHGGLSAFGDGTYLVAKIPAGIREKMADVYFLTACNSIINMDAVKRIGQISLKYWYIHYRDHDSAKMDEGKMPVFPKELGLRRDTAASLHFYMTGGLSIFYVDRIGPYSDIELQRLLEKKFPGEKYWMGTKMVQKLKTGRGLICFQNPQRLFSFELGEFGEYIGEHEKGAVECPSLASSDNHVELKGRLIFRPQAIY